MGRYISAQGWAGSIPPTFLASWPLPLQSWYEEQRQIWTSPPTMVGMAGMSSRFETSYVEIFLTELTPGLVSGVEVDGISVLSHLLLILPA